MSRISPRKNLSIWFNSWRLQVSLGKKIQVLTLIGKREGTFHPLLIQILSAEFLSKISNFFEFFVKININREWP